MSLTARPWFASFRPAPRRPRQKIAGRRLRSRRLFLEPLEDRTLLAASIRGSVWNDLVPDGVRAGGEPGLAGVMVTLDQSGSHTQALTNGSGEYSFTGLAAGTYTVGIIVPDGASLTFSGGGAVQVTGDQVVNGGDFGVQAAPTVIANQDATNDAAAQQMPSVAVDPTDASHIVMAYMDYGLQANGFAGLGVKVSHDAGQTWTTTSVPLPSDFNQAAGNPVVRFDGQGQFFVTFMAATFKGTDSHGNPLLPGVIYDTSNANVDGQIVNRRVFGMMANNGIFVAAATDDGAGNVTWTAPVAVGTGDARAEAQAAHLYTGTKVPFEVLPDLAIDTNASLPDGTANPSYGSIYVTWTRIFPSGQFPGHPEFVGGSAAMIAVSHDGGQTWTTQLTTRTVNGKNVLVTTIRDPLTVNSDSPAEGRTPNGAPSRVTVGPEGGIYVSIFAGGRFPIFYSTNGGATFRRPDPFNVLGYPFGDEISNPDPFPVSFPVPNTTLDNDTFRTLSVRDIVADPAHPGRVYAVEAIRVPNLNLPGPPGGPPAIDVEINFAVSNDYGLTWQTTFTVGSNPLNLDEAPPALQAAYRSALNDDDGSRFLGFDSLSDLKNEVISGQALPQMSVDAQGNITVIWYDTRRDPANHSLDVYGTTSTDGGLTFSANYRISTQNFDPNAGAPTDGAGHPYLGDRIGLASANGNVYAAWTDARNGNQDVYFGSYSLAPAPVPLNDRYEPNDTPATATDLGRVSVERLLPRLSLTSDDQDWFKVTAAATGTLTVFVSASTAGQSLQLELWDASGTVRLATGIAVTDQAGQVVGQRISLASVSGRDYLVRVAGGLVPLYSLSVQSLTADLGPTVQGSLDGTISSNEQAVYRLVTVVSGSLAVTLTGGTGLTVQVVSGDGQTVLASGNQINVSIDQGQVVLLQVMGDDSTSTGSYHLHFSNLDQFETSGPASLFFPVSGASSGIAAANLNGDQRADLVVTSNLSSDTVSVLTGNGDGTFQAPHQFGIGPANSTQAVRQPEIADLNRDNIPDLIVTNYNSADVSILLGRGDGSYAPELRFDATFQPDAVAVDDFNGDKIPDLAVLGRVSGAATLAILVGRGDGTFAPPQTMSLPLEQGTYPVRAGDVNGDGKKDLVVFGTNTGTFEVLLGNGDASFTPGGTFSAGDNMFDAQLADVNEDGNLDVIVGSNRNGNVYASLGNGDGTFQDPLAFSTLVPGPGDNVGIFGLAVVDFGSSDGATGVGPADGIPDIVVSVASRLSAAPPQLFLLPGLGTEEDGTFDGFDRARSLATLNTAAQIVTADFNGDGPVDVAAIDQGGVRVIYGQPLVLAADTTPATARELGTVVHSLSPTLAIVTGHEDAYYLLTAPTESVPGAGDEVLDFSARFDFVQGAGLQMEVLDAVSKQVLGSGSRLRVRAAQGQQLLVHIFGRPAGGGLAQGAGVYTLDIDVLPQVVSAEAPPPVPGGSASSIVLAFQGDRLDRATAENPANYRVTWLGADGLAGTADDRVLAIASASGGQPVLYNPGANVDVSTGRTSPTAIRQTVTLLFAEPLPAGSYQIEIVGVQAASFNADEAGRLAAANGFTGHSLVSLSGSKATEGSRFVAANLVAPASAAGNFDAYATGTRFLTQLHDDLSAQLDAKLRTLGDSPAVTQALLNQLLDRFVPSLGDAPPRFLILWLDPVSINLADAQGERAIVDLKSNAVSNNLARTSIEAGGNVEVLVLAGVAGTYTMNLSDVQPTSRGGAILIDGGVQTVALTDALRGGETTFTFDFSQTTATVVEAPGSGSAAGPAASAAVALTGAGAASVSPSNSLLVSQQNSATTAEAVSTGPGVLLGDVTPLSTMAASLVLGASPIAAGGGDSRADAGGQEALTPGEALNAVMEVFRAWSKVASDMGDAGETVASVARTGWGSVEAILALAREAVGEGNADMLDLGLRGAVHDLADTLMEAGKAVISDLANRLNRPGQGQGGTPAPQRLDKVLPTAPKPDRTSPPTPRPEEESDESPMTEESDAEASLRDEQPGQLPAALTAIIFAFGLPLARPKIRRHESNVGALRRKPGLSWPAKG